jgi:hypothetical protein
MTKFIKKGDTFHPTADLNLLVTDSLPTGTYTIRFSNETGFYLQQINDYESPKKLYGDVTKKAMKILSTFEDREHATGVLLSGEKGCGKSMLAKLLSLKGAERDFPTIVINQAWHGEIFNSFIQSINQPAIVLFDEFEKTYREREAQEAMLTLLDGVYPTKKLFVLTTNDKYGVNSYMLNRPGRLFYNIEYKSLSETFIKEYCEDKLADKTQIKSICQYSQAFESFNFDILKALVEEMNRYGENLQEAVSLLNIKADSFEQYFTVKLTINGETPYYHSWNENGEKVRTHPLKGLSIDYAMTKEQEEDEDIDDVFFAAEHLHSIKNGNYIFEKKVGKDNFRVVLTKYQSKALDYNLMALAA